jgi:hypothetical protein
MYVSDAERNPWIFFAGCRSSFSGFCHIGGQEPKIPWILVYRSQKYSKSPQKIKNYPHWFSGVA